MQTTFENRTSFAAGALSPELHAHVDLQKFSIGLKTVRNWVVQAQGGLRFRAGFEFVAELVSSAQPGRLIPFQFNTEQAYPLVFTDLKMRVIRNGGEVVEGDVAVSAVAAASPPTLSAVAHGYTTGDDVYVTGVTNCPGGPYRLVAPTADTVQLNDYDGNPIDGTTWVWTAAAKLNRVYTVASPFPQAAVPEINFTQSADVMSFAHADYAPRDLTRTGHASWSFSTVTFGATIAAPGSVTATPTGAGAVTYSYKVTAVDAETFEESVGSTAATCTNAGTLSATAYNTVTWGAVSGAAYYNVYKKRGGVWGFIGAAEAASYVDDGIIADMTSVPPTARTVFNATGKYPSTVAYHQQRRIYAAPDESPQNVKASRSGNYKNFNVSTPTQDDDAISFTIVAGQVNAIRHLVSLDELILHTAGGEWVVRGTNNGVLTPSSVYPKPQGGRGVAAQPAPLTVGDTVLFVDRSGARVRDLRYTLQSDKYSGEDLTILAAHLFENQTIVDWAYQQSPNSVVWAVRSDGVLLGFTFVREHDVWAWHEHTTDGAFESVCCIPEGADDVLYVIVRRTVNGRTKRYVERLHPNKYTDIVDAFHVDSGLSYTGDPVDELFGLDWLEGKTVTILADGNLHPSRTVVNGYVQLQAHYSTIQIGLTIPDADVEPLPIDPNQLVGPHKMIPRVILHLKDTRGLQVGPDAGDLSDLPQTITTYDTPLELITDDVTIDVASGWGYRGRFFLTQPYPLPATILGWTPVVGISEG